MRRRYLLWASARPLMLQGFHQSHRHELRLLVACLGLLSLVAAAVTQFGFVSQVDLWTVREVREASLPMATTVVVAVTTIGNTPVILAAAAVAVAGLAALGQWRGALGVALSIGLTEGFVTLFKHAVARPRPPSGESLAQAAGFSFPSGHAAATTAVFALVVWLATRHLRGLPRIVAVTAGAAVIVGVGLSRVYLGVHYPTDVMAGWLVGGALAFASWLVACMVWRIAARPGAAPA